jgi:hypothetical protein
VSEGGTARRGWHDQWLLDVCSGAHTHDGRTTQYNRLVVLQGVLLRLLRRRAIRRSDVSFFGHPIARAVCCMGQARRRAASHESVMAAAIVLVMSAIIGVLTGLAYHGMGKLARSKRVRAALTNWQARWRVPHVVVELAFVAVALPAIIAPFATVLSLPRLVAAAGIAAEPLVVLAAPITGLLALGVTMRARRRMRSRSTGCLGST